MLSHDIMSFVIQQLGCEDSDFPPLRWNFMSITNKLTVFWLSRDLLVCYSFILWVSNKVSDLLVCYSFILWVSNKSKIHLFYELATKVSEEKVVWKNYSTINSHKHNPSKQKG